MRKYDLTETSFLVIRDNDAIVNGVNADPWRWRQSNVFNWTDDLLSPGLYSDTINEKLVQKINVFASHSNLENVFI